MAPLRILAVSDLRVQNLRDLEAVAQSVKPDVILYAGDDVVRFGPGPTSWSQLALRIPHGLAGIIGNDCVEEDREALRQPGCHDLHEEPYVVGDLAILGLQGAPAAGGKPLGFTLYSDRRARQHLKNQLQAVGNRPAILVSHAPPYGILDLAMRFGLDHIGSRPVLDVLKESSIKAVVCGHVHLQGGKETRHRDCLVVNCASHDDDGAPLRYAILKWDGEKVTATMHVHDDRGNLREIPGMQRRHADTLRRKGITTLGNLYQLGVSELAVIVGGYAPRYWISAKAHVERRPVFRATPTPITTDALFVDVETSFDPADVWMVGFASWEGKVKQLHEVGRKNQHRLLIALDKRIRNVRPSQLLQWGTFDRSALEKAYRRYWNSVPPWLDPKFWANALQWTDRACALPLRSRSVKAVSGYFGFNYADDSLDGWTVGSWYSQYLKNKRRFNVSRVLVYNRDDVQALRTIVDSVIKLSRIESPVVIPSSTFFRSRVRTIDLPSMSEREFIVAKAIESYNASVLQAGTLNTGQVSISVTRYAAAMRRQYGLSERPPSD